MNTRLIAVTALALASPSFAQVIPSTDRGWYENTGFHQPSNGNYFTGQCATCLPTIGPNRSFFVFDLASVSDRITGATLCVFQPVDGLGSPDGSEPFALYDYSGGIPQLIAGTAGAAAYDDLGTGSVYGTHTFTVADDGSLVTIPLNGTALADLNAAVGSLFAMGGDLTDIDPLINDEYVFSSSMDTSTVKLVLQTEGQECFLVVGDGTEPGPFEPGMHSWTTQVGQLQDLHLVTLTDLPDIVLPVPARPLEYTPFHFGGTIPTHPGPNAPLHEFTVQVVMWNPEVFPRQPEQYSPPLRVSIHWDGSLTARSFGSGTGMEVWAETDFNSQGEPIVRFPFTIPGM